MMLDSDMCLAYLSNIEFGKCERELRDPYPCAKKFGDGRGEMLLAKDSNCCAWVDDKILFEQSVIKPKDKLCGLTLNNENHKNFAAIRENCCPGEKGDTMPDCDNALKPAGPAHRAVLDFAKDESVWLRWYKNAWTVATSNGFDNLKPLGKTGEAELVDGQKKFCQEFKESDLYKQFKSADL